MISAIRGEFSSKTERIAFFFCFFLGKMEMDTHSSRQPFFAVNACFFIEKCRFCMDFDGF
jgi:hypothetical protein